LLRFASVPSGGPAGDRPIDRIDPPAVTELPRVAPHYRSGSSPPWREAREPPRGLSAVADRGGFWPLRRSASSRRSRPMALRTRRARRREGGSTPRGNGSAGGGGSSAYTAASDDARLPDPAVHTRLTRRFGNGADTAATHGGAETPSRRPRRLPAACQETGRCTGPFPITTLGSGGGAGR